MPNSEYSMLIASSFPSWVFSLESPQPTGTILAPIKADHKTTTNVQRKSFFPFFFFFFTFPFWKEKPIYKEGNLASNQKIKDLKQE